MSSPEPGRHPAVPVESGSSAVAGAISPPLQGMPGGRDTGRGWRMLGCFVVAEVVFLAASVLVVLSYAIAAPQRPLSETLPPTALVAALLVPTMLAAFVATAGAALVGQGSLRQRLRSQLSLRWRWSDVAIGLGLGISFLVITLPAAYIWANWVGTSEADSAVGEAFDGQRLPLGLALTLFVGVWLVAPLCEEVLYRGVLWRALEHWRWNRWAIFALTTVLFSVAHLELLRTPLLLVISLPIALARMFTGNLLASIIAHQANNFLPAVGLLLITQGLLPA